MAVATMITKDMLIGDILEIEDGKYINGIAEFFFEIGMHCLGCPASRGETLEQACEVHKCNSDELLKKINDYLAEQE